MKLLVVGLFVGYFLATLAEEIRLVELEPNEAAQYIDSQDQTLRYAPKVESNVPALRFIGNQQQQVSEDIYLANQYHGQDGLGAYVYGYAVPDIAKTEKRTRDGNLKGGYNYVAGNGQEIKVEYWDNGDGFHQVDNIPTELPQDDPEVEAAKAEFLRIWQEEAIRNSQAPDPNEQFREAQRQAAQAQGQQYPGSQQGQYQPQLHGARGTQPNYQGQQTQAQPQYSPQGQAGPQASQAQQAVGIPTPLYNQQSVEAGQEKPVQKLLFLGNEQGKDQNKNDNVGQYSEDRQSYAQPDDRQARQRNEQQQARQTYEQQPRQRNEQQQAGQTYEQQQARQTNEQQQARQTYEQQQGRQTYGQQQDRQTYGQQQDRQTYGQQQNRQTYGQQQDRHVEEEEQGPPKGFFYAFDYPVGIIVSKQGGQPHKREDLQNAYNENKEFFESQLRGEAPAPNGASNGYIAA